MSLFRDHDWYPITRMEDPIYIEWNMTSGYVRVWDGKKYLYEYCGCAKGAEPTGRSLLMRGEDESYLPELPQ